MVDPVALARALIQAPSVTPMDHGCQDLLIRHLEDLGFTVHRLRFGHVENFYARLGSKGRNFTFAGHTDVVGAGDTSRWSSDPFAATLEEGYITGRGAVDMKGGLACMVAATARFLAARPHFAQQHSLSFLITGDEEGDALDGTLKVLQWLESQQEKMDYCLVGEPTSAAQLGDCIKNGRRGSVNGRLTIRGVQGHVAYPHLVDNPIHRAAPVLAAISSMTFDQGDRFFQPTSLQFTAVQSGGSATNVVPGELTAGFNIRFSAMHTPESLEARIRQVLDGAEVDYDLQMMTSGLPFITEGGPLVEAVKATVAQVTGLEPQLSTGGGTSDARFISRHCVQTVEFGLVGSTMHKVDERVPVADLEVLTEVYRRLLERLYPPQG
uniref:Succinyl-diaminopimelate desuccinylase n=2 Tax=Magnetococcus TaxID=162171 RepID=DAPE_MAGMM|nr:RecName: Full=Succinyl-diaminopimelate desuccinylase; Short=SDAP desuccinylase; AltName: Full=N-succinyl-LL-2,6-diaminoheptanedioate amidohydrolase [Magnetococcus marinus MC-1]